ncbi:MAG: PRC-barrel domain-containing protein [Patescibacteria group bacterium]|jgi:sporulation protein YlmC with PRC-barrel domain
MIISGSDLINLSVYTQSNKNLGRISDFEVDIEAHAIRCYYVKTGMIKGLWHQQLMISPAQVISVSKEKMVVEDSAAKQPEAELKKVKLASPITE